MPGRVLKRKATPVTADTTKQFGPPIQDFADSNPDWLRDIVFSKLKLLPPDEQNRIRDKILSDLRKAGVNITSGLMKLGIMATTPDELTPNDIAMLVRYARMNRPGAMKVAGASLSELIAAGEQTVKGTKPLKKVA